jgi:hypothetical protein
LPGSVSGEECSVGGVDWGGGTGAGFDERGEAGGEF